MVLKVQILLFQGGISGCGKKASQDIPFEKKIGHTGLDCCNAKGLKIQLLLTTRLRQTHFSYTLSLDLIAGKEQNGGMWHTELVLQQPIV